MRRPRWFALVWLMLSVWVAAPRVAADPPDPPAPEARSTEAPPLHGSLGEIDGLPALFLHGNVEERGFTEGYLCAERIQQLFDGFVLETPLVPFPRVWDAVVRPMLLHRADIPERTRRHIVAILAGMRARDPKTLRIPKLKRDLTVDDLRAATALPDAIGLMCSSYATWADRPGRQGAAPIVGRNLDYMGTRALTDNLMLIVHAPDAERKGWMSIGWPGLAGCVTGFSESGVFVAIHDVVHRSGDRRKSLPRLLALQELLESVNGGAESSLEATRLLRAHRFSMGGNCMFAWQGGAAVLELDGRQQRDGGVTLRAAQDHPWIVCSNHFRARPSGMSRCWRYARLAGALSKSNGVVHDLDAALELIRSSSKGDTLYRLASDLESGDVVLERRIRPGHGWHPTVHFNFRAILQRARRPEKPRPEGQQPPERL